MRARAFAVVLGLVCSLAARAAERAPDPLHSPVWDAMVARHLDGQAVTFDDRVRVGVPESAEDPLAVPVDVDASALGRVDEIRLIADLNPIPLILAYRPGRAAPRIGLRFKVEQSTPVRAAVRTPDGVWHVGGAWLRASGGGCTAPSFGTGSGLWRDRLNEVSGALWPRDDGGQRLKLRVIHPMDTGLAGGIPAFYVETVKLADASGNELATLHPYEPVSENPVFTFDLPTRGAVTVTGRDLQGNPIAGRVAP